MKDKILEVYNEAMAIKSFTNSKMEVDIENYLKEKLSVIEYFKKNNENFGIFEIEGDLYGRSVVWALVKASDTRAETVVVSHHHDTVDHTDFGGLKKIALNGDALKKEYRQEDKYPAFFEDASSEEWFFGKGSCDMKAALALQFAVLEEYAECVDSNEKDVSHMPNLLFISLPDEEAYSQGARSAIDMLYDLKSKFNLDYILTINSEPFESDSKDQKALHIGTVGKLMPVIVTQGILSHMKEPLKGLNSISLMAKIAADIDLNPQLCEKSRGEQSPLPSWNYLRDRKEVYDVSTILYSAGYFTVLHLEQSPKTVMEGIRAIVDESVKEFYEKYTSLQKEFYQPQNIPSPRVMFFDELKMLCKEKDGFEQFEEDILRDNLLDFKNGNNYQEICISNVEKYLGFLDKKEAIVVIAVAPPYNPSMSCRNLSGNKVDIEFIIENYSNYLKNKGLNLRVDEYFMGICDNSYMAMDKDQADYAEIMNSLGVPKSLYDINFDKLSSISMPAINLGPWGKELHQKGERVYAHDMLETVPEYILSLLEDVLV